MEWNQVLEHPSLQNIPFKVELNEWGKIVMTPASNLHGNLQVKIAMKLIQLLNEGEVSAEVSIQTSKNAKVLMLPGLLLILSVNMVLRHRTVWRLRYVLRLSRPIAQRRSLLKKENFTLPKGQRKSGSVMRAVRWSSLPMKAGLWNHGYILISLRIFINYMRDKDTLRSEYSADLIKSGEQEKYLKSLHLICISCFLTQIRLTVPFANMRKNSG